MTLKPFSSVQVVVRIAVSSLSGVGPTTFRFVSLGTAAVIVSVVDFLIENSAPHFAQDASFIFFANRQLKNT